jgi:hypothetical protein
VKSAFNQLVRDTWHLPQKAIKKRNEATLVKVAVKARKTSLKTPCETVKTLKQYGRRLKNIHEPGVRGFEPAVRGFEPAGTTGRRHLRSAVVTRAPGKLARLSTRASRPLLSVSPAVAPRPLCDAVPARCA